jgi:rod shape-determining protein MreC
MAGLQISRRRAIALLALTSVLLITFDLRGNAFIDGARDTFAVVFEPVRDGFRVVTRPVENAWRGITQYDDLARENDRLREEVDRQRGATIAAEASVREAQELLALNQLQTLAGVERVTAQVVGVSPSNFSETVEINQGSNRGIRVGMPVVNGAGVIGRVTQVFPDRSIVMLVTDPQYALAVKVITLPQPTDPTSDTTVVTMPTGQPPGVGVQSTTTTTTTAPPAGNPTDPFGPPVTQVPLGPGETLAPETSQPDVGTTSPSTTTPSVSGGSLRETGALLGRGPGRPPVVSLIDPSPRFGRIAVGAAVISAGGATSPAPPDLVVGTVSRVVDRPGSAGPLLEVELNANLGDLNFVMVLLYRPATEAPG